MASCTQTPRDSDAGEKPGAGTSLCAGETAHTIERRRFAEFMNLFVGPVAALSTEQNLLVKRELLQSLSRRSVYWIALLLVGSPFWFVFGSWIKTSDSYPLFRVVWILGLWGMVAPLAAYLLKKTMALPKHAGVSAVEQMHWAWAALVMLTSFWWAAASFGLIPPNFVVLSWLLLQICQVWLPGTDDDRPSIYFAAARTQFSCGFRFTRDRHYPIRI